MLTVREARAIAVHAAERPSRGSVEQVLLRLGVVQLDSISALARAHQLTLATRARVPVGEVDRQLWAGERPMAFETWAHAASLVPLAHWPLWRFRMRSVDRIWGRNDLPEETLSRRILDQVEGEGPLPIQSLRGEGERGGGWSWGPTRMAVEHLIRSGQLVCARRQGFRRIVDLPERVVPADLLDAELSDDACLDRLATVAVDVLGVATAADVADYLRIPVAQARDTLERLGLERGRVEGWKDPVWLRPDHAVLAARRAPARARFVGPFDNLVWYRARLARLFAFDHTLEAYLPAAKRVHGYYVCPLLTGTGFIGRADLAAGGPELRILRLSLIREDARSLRAVGAAVAELSALLGTTRVTVPPGASWAAAVA